jgi:hypothetical protein
MNRCQIVPVPFDPDIKVTLLGTESYWETVSPLWDESIEGSTELISKAMEAAERQAQVIALTLIKGIFSSWRGTRTQVLEHPWSDARYPSIVKIWGIDSLEEDSALFLDQVWLERYHPDRPQRWVIIATTTPDAPLSKELLYEDGVQRTEGTREYLEYILQEMQECTFSRSTRQLGKVLTQALAEGQLLYMHLDCVLDKEKQEWAINQFYEFPIYPALYTERPEAEALSEGEDDIEGNHSVR